MKANSMNLPVVLTIGMVFVSALAMAADNPPEPKVIDPGAGGSPPSDALVLFDGKDLSKWRGERGQARWKLADGVMEVNGTGNIFTLEEFGDCQLHVEWAAPREVKGDGQERGNSGVYLQGRYEIQVLDSYQNKTYPDGQAAAFYGNSPPMVNASRKPGEWQTYDVVFRAPRVAQDGKTLLPGAFTVFHNGVLVQDHVPVKGATTAARYQGAVPRGPLMLQDHGSAVRFRNIWIRPL
jgi:hypothetical protein